MYTENDDIIVNLTVTRRCHARCKDCINSSITFGGKGSGIPNDGDCNPERDARLVVKIAEKYRDKGITLCFYGGEPFLVPDVMDRVRLLLAGSEVGKRTRYMVYTSGELIADALGKYPDLTSGMWLYSISVDGGPTQHAEVRPGTSLERTLDSLEILRRAYSGNILIWSTLREEQSLLDCYRQFITMYRRGLADHFFWHWAETDQPFNDLAQYAGRYAEELDQIMQEYDSWIAEGKILPIAHINELILYFLEQKNRGHTACAVELARNYDILGGTVHACSDLPASLGAFNSDGDVEIAGDKLRSLVTYKETLGCYTCDVHWYCGGRCPVQALACSIQRTQQMCRLMHFHVNTVKGHIPFIQKMLERHNIGCQQLYDSSAFMARYTDAVP